MVAVVLTKPKRRPSTKSMGGPTTAASNTNMIALVAEFMGPTLTATNDGDLTAVDYTLRDEGCQRTGQQRGAADCSKNLKVQRL
jgi:hypothetical protein